MDSRIATALSVNVGDVDVPALLRALPELVDGGPSTLAGVPSGCRTAVRAACQAALPGLVEQAWAGSVRPPDVYDPLVSALIRLMDEGAAVADDAVAVPLMALALEATELLEGGGGEPFLRVASTRPPAKVLGVLAGGITARTALALSRVAASGRRVPAFATMMASQRLLFLYREADMDPVPDLGALSAVLGRSGQVALLGAAPALLREAVAGVLDRRASNRLTGEDQMLLAAYPGLRASDSLDPDVAALVLANPARFVQVPALLRAGVDPETVSALLNRAAHGEIVEVLAALRRFRMLSSLLSSVDTAAAGALPVPRGTIGRTAVTALGLGRVRSALARGVENTVSARLDRVWTEILGEQGVDLGFVGLRFHEDLGQAFRDMLAVSRAVAGRATVPVAALAYGPVGGGLAGDRLRAHGGPIDAAVRLAVGTNAALVVDEATVDPLYAALSRAGVPIDVVPGGLGTLPEHVGATRVFAMDGAVLVFRRVDAGYSVDVTDLDGWLGLAGLEDAARIVADSDVTPSPMPAVHGSRRGGMARALRGVADRARVEAERSEQTWFLAGPGDGLGGVGLGQPARLADEEPAFDLEVSDDDEDVEPDEPSSGVSEGEGLFVSDESSALTRPIPEYVLQAFTGYVCVLSAAEVVFGRPYDGRMIDRHAYPAGDLEKAYLGFLREKAAEGFVLRPELIGPVPEGSVTALERYLLDRAWGRLF